VDGNDVQLLVGASAPPPGIFAPMESATQRTVQEILESINLPIDPAELETMINEAIIDQTIAAEDLSTLIAALEGAESQLAEESTPILVSQEPSPNPVKQEVVPTSQQEVQAASKVQDIQAVQEEQGVQDMEVKVLQAAQREEMDDDPIVGLSAEDLAQALRQLPETGPSPQNGRISLGMLSRQPHVEATVMLMSLSSYKSCVFKKF